MATNPLVPQGSLSRIIASVVWSSFPQLNVTAPFLGKAGISLAFEGVITTFIDTMTGGVKSPEPYQRANLTMNLLKTQPLAAAYKAQLETLASLGNGVVRPDTTALGVYPLTNCAIENVETLRFNGEDAGWVVTVKGYYNINAALFDLAPTG